MSNLRKVLDWIKDNPEHWDQKRWHCGTSHCFIGVADMFLLGLSPKESVKHDSFYGYTAVKAYLGITRSEFSMLCHSANTLQDLEFYIEQIERTPRVLHCGEKWTFNGEPFDWTGPLFVKEPQVLENEYGVIFNCDNQNFPVGSCVYLQFGGTFECILS